MTRGAATDSVHYGSVAVVDRNGKLLFAAGDPHYLTTTRSALKPLQAVPFVARGGVERFGYSAAQVALLCASHSGEPRHVEAVADMLERAGCTPADLQCGIHPPLYYTAREEPPPAGVRFTSLHHNCSGKHSGMLAYCRLCGLPTDSYLDFDHPLQLAIRAAVAHLTGVPEEALVAGIDGCSAPNYAVPLDRLAHAFARLASAAEDDHYGTAPARLAAAMTAHPEMVSGVRSRGWGIALKVVDGNARGLHPATVAVLDQLGLLDEARRAALAPWREPAIRNYRGLTTGRVVSTVELERRT